MAIENEKLKRSFYAQLTREALSRTPEERLAKVDEMNSINSEAIRPNELRARQFEISINSMFLEDIKDIYSNLSSQLDD